jgi:ankyrin repeat protein
MKGLILKWYLPFTQHCFRASSFAEEGGYSSMFPMRISQALKQLLPLFALTMGAVLICDIPAAVWAKENRVAELIRAIRDGESNNIDKLIKKNNGMDVQDDYGWTPLMYAVLGNNLDVIEKLLSHGADTNLPDRDGVTALIASIINAPQPFMVQYLPEKDKRTANIPLVLIEKGADPNRADNDGNTPLIYAVIGSHATIVEALIKKGADPNRADSNGCTPLYFINHPDKAAEWAPAQGALSSRRRMSNEPSDESRFTPQYAEQVAKAREEANAQLKLTKTRIAELLRGAGAAEPDPSRIKSAGRHRIDSRPRRLTMAGPNDPFFEVLHNQMMSGNRAAGSRYHLLVCVAPDGTVKKSLVVAGMPNGVSEKLQKAAFKARYQPAIKDGQPVEEWDTVIGFFTSGPGLPRMIP